MTDENDLCLSPTPLLLSPRCIWRVINYRLTLINVDPVVMESNLPWPDFTKNAPHPAHRSGRLLRRGGAAAPPRAAGDKNDMELIMDTHRRIEKASPWGRVWRWRLSGWRMILTMAHSVGSRRSEYGSLSG